MRCAVLDSFRALDVEGDVVEARGGDVSWEDAPYSAEPVTAAEERAIERGLSDVAAGRVSSLEDVGRRLGLV